MFMPNARSPNTLAPVPRPNDAQRRSHHVKKIFCNGLSRMHARVRRSIWRSGRGSGPSSAGAGIAAEPRSAQHEDPRLLFRRLQIERGIASARGDEQFQLGRAGARRGNGVRRDAQMTRIPSARRSRACSTMRKAGRNTATSTPSETFDQSAYHAPPQHSSSSIGAQPASWEGLVHGDDDGAETCCLGRRWSWTTWREPSGHVFGAIASRTSGRCRRDCDIRRRDRRAGGDVRSSPAGVDARRELAPETADFGEQIGALARFCG